MASSVTRPFESPSPNARLRAQQDLRLCWQSLRAVSSYVQQLDEPGGDYKRWADVFVTVEQMLKAAGERVDSWPVLANQGEDSALVATRRKVSLYLVRVANAVHFFDWNDAQGWIFAAGDRLLYAASVLGVEL